jgi:hypothetical protein
MKAFGKGQNGRGQRWRDDGLAMHQPFNGGDLRRQAAGKNHRHDDRKRETRGHFCHHGLLLRSGIMAQHTLHCKIVDNNKQKARAFPPGLCWRCDFYHQPLGIGPMHYFGAAGCAAAVA